MRDGRYSRRVDTDPRFSRKVEEKNLENSERYYFHFLSFRVSYISSSYFSSAPVAIVLLQLRRGSITDLYFAANEQ